MITDRGLQPMVMIWMTPSWVTGSTDERVPPTTSADSCNTGRPSPRVSAARFPQVTDWEIWNEPNSTTSCAARAPSVYAKVLASAYQGIKAGNPSARVIFARHPVRRHPVDRRRAQGWGPGNVRRDGRPPVHGGQRSSPEQPGHRRHLADEPHADSAQRDADARRDKPIWFTEFGWRVGSIGTENGNSA